MFNIFKKKVLKEREEKEKIVENSILEFGKNKKDFENLRFLCEKDMQKVKTLYKNNEIMIEDGYITNENKCIEECDNNIIIIDKCLNNIEKHLVENKNINSSKFVKYNEELEKILITLRENFNKIQERREKILNNIENDKINTKEKKYKD